jgi:hypothetical protein
MLLDDFWWGVADFYLSDSEAWRSHIRISRISGFTGCWLVLRFFGCEDFCDVGTFCILFV